MADEISDEISKQQSQIEGTIDKTTSEVNTVLDNVKQFILEQGISILLKIVFVLIVYFVAKKIKKVVIRLIDKALSKSSIEVSVVHFVVKLCDVLFSLVIIIAIVGYLGIDTSSLVALVGSAGLAAGLALQGSLSNFAGGILILIMKPFKIGDYISTSGAEGTVTGIDIFYTKITTIDNRTVVIPNGALSNANIENFTAMAFRRIILNIPVSYSENLKEVKDVLMDTIEKQENIIKDSVEYAPQVFVNAFEDSHISIGVRAWVQTETYWPTRWALLESIKNTFDEHNITIPYNQLDVNLVTETVKKSS